VADEGFAVTLFRDADQWQCALLPPAVMDDLDSCLTAVRQQPPEGGPMVLVDVEDEFFVVLRLATESGRAGDVRLLLSDVTAAADYDLARQAVDRLGEELPAEEDMDEIWPVGDLRVFADLGLDEFELRNILDDLDLYADEMLVAIAHRIGLAEPYARVVDALPR
jgi:putative tRNA adenosine deaminase-associated protein